MKIQLDRAEYQTLAWAEHEPKSRGLGAPRMNVDECIKNGLAERYSRPGYSDTDEYRLTDLGRKALHDARKP